MDREAWQAIVHEIAKSWTWLCDFHFSTPRSWTDTSPWPFRNQTAQQQVGGGQGSQASPATPLSSPHSQFPTLALSPAPFISPTPSTSPTRPPHIPYPWPGSGKTVFHKTGPWCQKGWGPLAYKTKPFSVACFSPWPIYTHYMNKIMAL